MRVTEPAPEPDAEVADSAFALPPRLARKAGPALVAADDAHLARVGASLDHAVATLAARLVRLRAAPGGHGQAALDRDLEIHRTTARLRALRRFGLDLCLGRTVPVGGGTTDGGPREPGEQDEHGPMYVGRLGLADEDGQRLLVDWRSPAAAPFFGATRADPMGLSSRRRYRWGGGKVRDYWDEVFVGEAGVAADGLALDEESAFVASLGSSRTERMRDVLGTIAADQDAVVRAGSRGALVVDGGPGTGKTVVALHRAAYLLYTNPRMSSGRSGVLVVGPHQPYLDYVSDVLPSLGEDGVQTCTLRDLLVEGATAVVEPDPEVAALKGTVEMVRAVEAAVRVYEEPPTEPLTVTTPWAEVTVDAATWAEAFEAPEPGTSHNEGQDHVWEALVGLVVDAHRATPDGAAAEDELVRRAVRQDRGLRRALTRSWPVLEAADLVGDLWTVPAYLRLCAPHLDREQVRALQRADAQAWTVPDLPLLDAARQRLGDPSASARRRRFRAAVAEGQEQVDKVIDNLVQGDDGEGLVTMLRHQDLQYLLVEEAVPDEQDPDLLAGPFAHVVVDEAQELTDAEWQMVLGRCPSRSLTVVGDRTQARRGFPESWEDRLHRVGVAQVRVASLTVGYRTPHEVMAEAEPVIRAVLPDANVPTSVRSSGLPVRHGRVEDLERVVQEWAAAHDEGVACVVGAPWYPGADRVRSLAPELVKGLEFDLVVLVDPAGFGDGVLGAVDRYVAMTRATQQLVVLEPGPR